MEYNEVGKIVQSHGIKGEVKIKTDSSFIDERFKENNKLYLKDKSGYKEIIVKSHRSMQNYELVSFIGYDDIDSVMPLMGKTLYGERDKNLLEDDGHFYSDLINMNVYQFGKMVGMVKEIQYHPHCDYLIVVNEEKLQKMVPLLDEFIVSINESENAITIVDMEGLLYD